ETKRGDRRDAKRQQKGQYPRAVQHALVPAEFVPDPLYRSDVIVSDLFAHFANVYVDRAGEHVHVGAPDILQQLVATKYLVGILREEKKQFKFLLRQGNFLAVMPDRIAGAVDDEVTGNNCVGALLMV